MKKPVLTIGIPCRGNVDPQWAYWLKELNIPQEHFSDYELLMPQNMQVDEARNYIVEKMKGDYVFFLDSDVLCPSDTIQRLMTHKKDVVSGLYFTKKAPFSPNIFKKSDADGRWDTYVFYDHVAKKNPLIEVGSAGMGCCLIKKEVLDKVGMPWFYFTNGYKKDIQRESEDHSFFRRCGEEKIKVFCDTSIKCGHIGTSVITEPYWLETRKNTIDTNKPN